MESTPALPTPRRFSLKAGFTQLLCDARRFWYLFAGVAIIWVLALLRLFANPSPLLPVLFNWTDSLPYLLAYVDYGAVSHKRGDYIVYSFRGEASETAYPGLRDQPFFKQIVGVPGDVVTVQDRDVFVNGVHVGRAKTHTKEKRLPLEPIAPVVIPAGFFYVRGTSRDSFDSRYRSSGLVPAAQVLAKVNPIF